MNKKPVSYLQTDARWKALRLPCSGGTMSLGGGGCGPTSAAMLLSTLTGKAILPAETFRWCCEHGYMYANQGTEYGYFPAQFKAYGIDCERIAGQCMSTMSPVRLQVEKMLREGYYFIALMKKGLWTSGGHYVVMWWADDKIRINDPASTSAPRTGGDPAAFWPTAKYFWRVDARSYNNSKTETEEDDVKRYQTMDEIKAGASWAEATVKKLIDKKIIGGNGAGLDLSEDMLRMLVFNDRAGVYGK